MNITKFPAIPLKKGDSFTTVAASSFLENVKNLERGQAQLESWGLKSIKNIAGSFGCINLEDIAAPDCFII